MLIDRQTITFSASKRRTITIRGQAGVKVLIGRETSVDKCCSRSVVDKVLPNPHQMVVWAGLTHIVVVGNDLKNR